MSWIAGDGDVGSIGHWRDDENNFQPSATLPSVEASNHAGVTVSSDLCDLLDCTREDSDSGSPDVCFCSLLCSVWLGTCEIANVFLTIISGAVNHFTNSIRHDLLGSAHTLCLIVYGILLPHRAVGSVLSVLIHQDMFNRTKCHYPVVVILMEELYCKCDTPYFPPP
eukprot:jgi/Botrbrau1/17426/Bobra.0054s0020.1